MAFSKKFKSKIARTKALRVKISGVQKGMCEDCRVNIRNARLGRAYKLPPLHPHCRCEDNLKEILGDVF